jgi:peptide deformylase
VAIHPIRQYGDPVLRQRTREVENIDGAVAKLVADMIETMYDAPGMGLAANQIGVQRRLFVYDAGEGARPIINPRILETDGEWTYDEACLSVAGLSWPIVRPDRVHLVGLDLDGNEVSIEADTLEGRCFQHEMDHLDGLLLVERLDDEQRREAMRVLRARTLSLPLSPSPSVSPSPSLSASPADGAETVGRDEPADPV